MDRKAELARRLEEVRARTLWLLDRVPDEFLRKRVHAFYSPVGWHFGHVGRTEEAWAVNEAMGEPVRDSLLDFLFTDRPDNPKDNRVNIPDREGLREYLRETRVRSLDALHRADLQSDDPLLAGGYAWDFAIQHECQHQETICEMLQLIQLEMGRPATVEPLPWRRGIEPARVALPGGSFIMGTSDREAYDNEHDPHEVEVAPFAIDRSPATAFDWTEFMEDGGYERRDLWSDEGWGWLQREAVCRPEYWLPAGHFMYGVLGPRPIHPDEPASSLSGYEAEAYARWRGGRLPTEEEWECLASLTGGRYAWGGEEPSREKACFGMESLQPMPVGREQNGVLDLAGNVWEWTASAFLPYPGFCAYPYDGYSKAHMDGRHRVCRGGSWATASPLLRHTFRNWYVPSYRQGFLGVRCAYGST